MRPAQAGCIVPDLRSDRFGYERGSPRDRSSPSHTAACARSLANAYGCDIAAKSSVSRGRFWREHYRKAISEPNSSQEDGSGTLSLLRKNPAPAANIQSIFVRVGAVISCLCGPIKTSPTGSGKTSIGQSTFSAKTSASEDRSQYSATGTRSWPNTGGLPQRIARPIRPNRITSPRRNSLLSTTRGRRTAA